jgi:hypothetical protein
VTGIATHANQRPARSVAADGCPRPGLLLGTPEWFGMSGYAEQRRLDGRLRVPR